MLPRFPFDIFSLVGFSFIPTGNISMSNGAFVALISVTITMLICAICLIHEFFNKKMLAVIFASPIVGFIILATLSYSQVSSGQRYILDAQRQNKLTSVFSDDLKHDDVRNAVTPVTPEARENDFPEILISGIVKPLSWKRSYGKTWMFVEVTYPENANNQFIISKNGQVDKKDNPGKIIYRIDMLRIMYLLGPLQDKINEEKNRSAQSEIDYKEAQKDFEGTQGEHIR